jgi:recombination protein RecA
MAERIRLRAGNGGGGNYFATPKNNLAFIPSGCRVLDLALGGGWAENRISNIVGDKSTGKTLLAIEASANFALKYPKSRIYYREAEAAFDERYAKAIGMPVERVDFGKPMDTVEDVFEDIGRVLEKSSRECLYIVDSLDALSDRAEMGRSMDQGTYGAEKAKKLSQLFRRQVRDMKKSKMTLIVISQVRDKIGVTFGRKTTRTGGHAMDFYASQVVYLSHIKTLQRTAKGTKRASGVEVRAKLDKNKVGLPFREAQFPILFGYGIDDVRASLMYLAEVNELKKAGYHKDDVVHLSRELMRGPADEEQAETKKLHRLVEENWYAIEKSLLPKRQKYGGS